MIWNKNKSKINLEIDGIMLVLLMLITGLGFLIKYVLVPGFKRNVLYGSDVEIYFLGLDRHQWGGIHLYLGLVFLGLMLIHIVLHWKMITSIFRRMVVEKTSRRAIALCSGVVVIFLALAPLFIHPEISALVKKHTFRESSSELREERQNVGQSSFPVLKTDEMPAVALQQTTKDLHKKQSENTRENDFSAIEINGSMTLKEISNKYSISVNELTRAINVPVNQRNERIGRLKRRYGFEMAELKDKVVQLKKNS